MGEQHLCIRPRASLSQHRRCGHELAGICCGDQLFVRFYNLLFLSLYIELTFYDRILILASAVFFYHSGGNGDDVPADLFEAHDLIKERVGKGVHKLS